MRKRQKTATARRGRNGSRRDDDERGEAKKATSWLGGLRDEALSVRARAEDKAAELVRIADSASAVPTNQLEDLAMELSGLEEDEARHLRVVLVGGRYQGEHHDGCGPFANAQEFVARFLAEAERLAQSKHSAGREYFAELR